jgi:hypothetical protein
MDCTSTGKHSDLGFSDETACDSIPCNNESDITEIDESDLQS